MPKSILRRLMSFAALAASGVLTFVRSRVLNVVSMFLAAQRGGHAHQNVRPKLGQLPGKNAALGGAAEHHCPHTRYPRGVTMRPCSTRVLRLPMYTVVNISTGVCSSWASVST